MQLLAVPAVAAVALVYWRFLCELFMLAFLAYERLGEVRDLMRIAAGQRRERPIPIIRRSESCRKRARQLRRHALARARVAASSKHQFDLICTAGFSAPALRISTKRAHAAPARRIVDPGAHFDLVAQRQLRRDNRPRGAAPPKRSAPTISALARARANARWRSPAPSADRRCC